VSFALDIEKFSNDAIAAVENTRRIFIGNLCLRIIDRTPVLSGHLKGNWQPSIGAAEQDEVPRASKDGAFVKQLVLDTLAKLTGDETFYLSNNAPYVIVIEYEGHSSVKAPEGMVRISLAEVGALVNEAIREGGL
jgi:hypothetical protein